MPKLPAAARRRDPPAQAAAPPVSRSEDSAAHTATSLPPSPIPSNHAFLQSTITTEHAQAQVPTHTSAIDIHLDRPIAQYLTHLGCVCVCIHATACTRPNALREKVSTTGNVQNAHQRNVTALTYIYVRNRMYATYTLNHHPSLHPSSSLQAGNSISQVSRCKLGFAFTDKSEELIACNGYRFQASCHGYQET